MSQETENRKVIALVIVAIVIAILMCVYVFWLLFGGSEQEGPAQEQVTTFPDSEQVQEIVLLDDEDETTAGTYQPPVGTATDTAEEILVAVESDWRDEVIKYSNNQSSYTEEAPANEVEEPIYVYENYDEDYDSPVVSSPPPSYVTPSRSAYISPNDIPISIIYDKLSESSFSNCGKINAPNTEEGLEELLLSIAKNPEAICLGKAIAKNCEGARVAVSNSFYSGYIYVAERNDGVCGIGSTFDRNMVSLCSVEDLMNLNTNQQNNFSYWQNLFDDDPGQTFADAYEGSLNYSESGKAVDCQLYRL